MKRKMIITISLLMIISALLTGCRNIEEERILIDRIVFTGQGTTIREDQEQAVNIRLEPSESRRFENVQYSVSNEGIIQLSNMTNDGLVIKGLRDGNTVLVARGENATSYYQVVVERGAFVMEPFITVGSPVVNMLVGETRNLQVTLNGGSVIDNNGFTWITEIDKDHITIDTTMNTVVIRGNNRGTQRIRVSHPKSQFDGEILVFVRNPDENPIFITSDRNVVMLENDGRFTNIVLMLVGGQPEDVQYFDSSIIEGQEVVEAIQSQENLNIRVLRTGTALIRIRHPKAEYDFDIRIIAVDSNAPLITTNRTFAMIRPGANVTVTAALENPRSNQWMNEFEYELPDNGEEIIRVTQTNNQFYIEGLKEGPARLVIKNHKAQFAREVLIIVNDDASIDVTYITTSQNIIQTEVGAGFIELRMALVGGNIGDSNSFTWLVSDGNIIEVEAVNGNVILQNRAQITNVDTGVAMITPVSSGTSRITISHPKSETTAEVIVKVYPRGTFTNLVSVQGPGLIQVLRNEEKTVNLQAFPQSMAGNVGELRWEIPLSREGAGIATIDNLNTFSMENLIRAGNISGISKLAVNGVNIRQPYEGVLWVGTQQEFNTSSVIYVDNLFQRVGIEQAVNIEIKDTRNALANSTGFTASGYDTSLIYVAVIRNRIMIQGLAAGETKLLIRNNGAMNEIELTIRTEYTNLTIDKPYYIEGPDFIGVVAGQERSIRINLYGAPAVETGKIEWEIEETNIVNLIGNGSEGRITGLFEGLNKQTYITVKHTKSQNEKRILVYVVATEAELEGVVVLGIDRRNHLMRVGEELFLRLTTNATLLERQQIVWTMVNPGIAGIEPNNDSALVTAFGLGNAEIRVTHNRQLNPLSIFVSVGEAPSGEKTIQIPAITEILIGDSRIITARTNNLSNEETRAITWDVDAGTNVISVQGNGDTAYIIGRERGVTNLNIRQSALGLSQRSLVLCAATPEELASMYVLGVDRTLYNMRPGEQVVVRLQFGSGGFPENEIANIKWEPSACGTVTVSPNGDSATITARANGTGTVRISHEGVALNQIVLNFNVSSSIIADELWWGEYRRIQGIIVNQTENITLRYNDNSGNEETTGYGNLRVWLGDSVIDESEWSNENNIIRVNLSGNILRITAKSAGQTFINVWHPRVAETARILVYTANTQEELDRYYPMIFDKRNHLVQSGQTVVMRLITEESKDAEYLNEVQWSYTNASLVASFTMNGRKEANLITRGSGQIVVSVRFRDREERIFISVVEHLNVDMSKRISTQSIVGVVRGSATETRIVTNLTQEEINTLVWESSNAALITVEGNGETAIIKSTIPAGGVIPANNEAYVIVRHGTWLRRHILVYVVPEVENLNSYRAMNMENQYVRIGPNEEIILPVYYAPQRPAGATNWVHVINNGVVSFTVEDNGDRVRVRSYNEEGVAHIRANNNNTSNVSSRINVHIEVSRQYADTGRIPENKFLTTSRNIFIFNPDDITAIYEISIEAIGLTLEEYANIQWRAGANHPSAGNHTATDLITVQPLGSDRRKGIIRINSNGNEGEAWLSVWHPAANILNILIIVSRNPVVQGVPQIIFDDNIRIGMGQSREFEARLEGIRNYDQDLFEVEIISNRGNIQIEHTGRMIRVNGFEPGQAMFKISHPDSSFEGYRIVKQVLVIVTSTPDGLIYFTTRDNFSVLRRNETRVLEVNLVGYEEYDANNIVWYLHGTSNQVVELRGNGRFATITGINNGSARITVSHRTMEIFGIDLQVRVSSDIANPIYLSTERNIMAIIEGDNRIITAELVNGNPAELNQIQWWTNDTNMIEVTGSGTQAMVRGIREGTARVFVSHPALTVTEPLSIIVIVERDYREAGIYITTDTFLVEMRPTDTSRRITVHLVGGNPQDVIGFQWEIVHHDSIERLSNGASRPVITLTPANEAAILGGMEEGTAVIRVSHPRTNHRLEITVDVKTHSRIELSESMIQMNRGETRNVNINVPTGMYIVVNTSNPGIVNTTNTNRVLMIEGIAPGVVTITVRNQSGSTFDEVLVEVREVDSDRLGWIQTSTNLLELTLGASGQLISASLHGNNINGQPIIVSGGTNFNNTLRWEVETQGRNIIGFNNVSQINASHVCTNNCFTDNCNARHQGQQVTVMPKAAGNAVIMIRHEGQLGSYVRRIHVTVNQNNATFRIIPDIIELQKNQSRDINVDITNVGQQTLDQIRGQIQWATEGGIGLHHVNTSAAEGRVHVGSGTGQRVLNWNIKDGNRQILTLTVPNNISVSEDIVFDIVARVPSGPASRAVIYIKPDRSLDILGPMNYKVLINQETRVFFRVIPAMEHDFSNITTQLSSNSFLEINTSAFNNRVYNVPGDGNRTFTRAVNNRIAVDSTRTYGMIEMKASPVNTGPSVLTLRAAAAGSVLTQAVNIEVHDNFRFEIVDIYEIRNGTRFSMGNTELIGIPDGGPYFVEYYLESEDRAVFPNYQIIAANNSTQNYIPTPGSGFSGGHFYTYRLTNQRYLTCYCPSAQSNTDGIKRCDIINGLPTARNNFWMGTGQRAVAEITIYEPGSNTVSIGAWYNNNINTPAPNLHTVGCQNDTRRQRQALPLSANANGVIRIIPNTAGAVNIQVYNPKNADSIGVRPGAVLTIPAKIFYENVGIEYKIVGSRRVGNSTVTNSRIDITSRAIVIENGGGLDIRPVVYGISNNSKIPILVREVTGTVSGGQNTVSVPVQNGITYERARYEVASIEQGRVARFQALLRSGSSNVPALPLGSLSLIHSEYMGNITLTYKYYRGGRPLENTSFQEPFFEMYTGTSNFLNYLSIYRRPDHTMQSFTPHNNNNDILN